MPALASDLRRQLENVCVQARDLAEAAARSALQKRAVDAAEPFLHFTTADKELRVRLRARGRQVGESRDDKKKTQTIDQLTQELAYEYWHRMLFARFLAENNLLMHPDGVPVSLKDCNELAKSEGAPNGFVLAARYASRMLPQVFRTDDVLLEIEFAPEQRLALEKELAKLPKETFLASDSLGWCYQFWQAKRKDEVNASGKKIGAAELPVVTQLFTEDYMVDFLLDNTLGAWWAGKILAANPKITDTARSEDQLRKAVALPGVPWRFLRFVKDKNGKWRPAAGAFEGWPKTAKELKCLDPCMGSGHFVVAIFERLVALRMTEEPDEPATVAAVIRENVFGLEIDPRCTQIGAFNLALAAWRRVGHRSLPVMNLACSGLASNARKDEWVKLAENSANLRFAMATLYELFQNAPMLGSLINPRQDKALTYGTALHQLQPLLDMAMNREKADDTHELAVTARGLVKAAEILADQFTLVATNVPYLGRGNQDDLLKEYSERVHPMAKPDLATCFVERCLAFCTAGGTTALVTPQNWLFLTTYKNLRIWMLETHQWGFAVRLGPRAFETIGGEVVNVALLSFTNRRPENKSFFGLDAGDEKTPSDKIIVLLNGPIVQLSQQDQLTRPDGRVVLEPQLNGSLLSNFASSNTGLQTGDNDHYSLLFSAPLPLARAWTAT